MESQVEELSTAHVWGKPRGLGCGGVPPSPTPAQISATESSKNNSSQPLSLKKDPLLCYYRSIAMDTLVKYKIPHWMSGLWKVAADVSECGLCFGTSSAVVL